MGVKKATFAFIAATLTVAGGAQAADLPLPVKAALWPDPVYNWTGFYLGANVGVSAGVAPITQTSTFLPAPPGPPGINNQSTHNLFGAIGGGQVGYSRQFGRFVAGIEADMQASGQRSDQSCLTFCDFNFMAPANVQFDSVQQRIAWFATVRPRVGYASGPVLFYVTGGLAVANIRTSYSTTELAQFSGQASDTRAGGAVGAGIEAALIGNWTAKIEYLYLDFGNVSDTFIYQTVGFFGPGSARSDVSGRVVDHVARAGVNYRFGDPAAPALWWDAAPVTAPLITKGPVVDPVAYSWTGFYVGGNVGYSVGNDPLQENIFGVFGNGNERLTLVPRGVLGGGQAGYNYQPVQRFVVGVEGDIQGANQRDTACFSWCPPIPLATPTTYSQTLNWFATARGRAGVTAGPALFYVTGGGAWTRVNTNASQVNSITNINGVTTLFTGAGSFADNLSGWTAGFGAEGAIAGRWTAKVEYLYMDFGSIAHQYPAAIPTNLADTNIHFSTRVRDNVFRVGANYHL
jgi:outer membrane immunogenic protein